MRGLFVSLIAIGLALVVVALLTGLILVLALVVGLAVLNVVYLPRMAAYLRIRVAWLALMLIPFMILAGVAVLGNVGGATWGIGLWLAAIGLPRAIGHDVLRRVRRWIEARLTYYDVPATADASRKWTEDPGARPLPPADDRGRGESGL